MARVISQTTFEAARNAVSALDQFNTVVGVASLVLDTIGISRPDPTEEKPDELREQIQGLSESMDELRKNTDRFLGRLDDFPKNDLATAMTNVDAAASGPDRNYRQENPSQRRIDKIIDDSEDGLRKVLAGLTSLPAETDPNAATYMAEAVTYAVGKRFQVIEELKYPVVGRPTGHLQRDIAATRTPSIRSYAVVALHPLPSQTPSG